MIFSGIASRFRCAKNPLYRERDALLDRGERVVDLISGNVNSHGIVYPQETLGRLASDAIEQARIYRPDPRGQRAAREAIRAYYLTHGLDFPVDHIILTPGTSLSYWYCFKLLADPGDEILSPKPSYPLFDHIAELSGVRMVPYALREERGWEIDLDQLEAAITPRSRAIIVISPHNPTGKVATSEELDAVAEIAGRHRLAVLSDEVFSEFLFEDSPLSRAARTSSPLVFTLNGFSKMFALPGWKIGWMVLSGEESLVSQAIDIIETISDALLPVGEVQQFAVPEIFRQGDRFRKDYVRRIRERCKTAVDVLSGSAALRLTSPQGGFYLCARLTDPRSDEEAVAVDLLREERLLLHPGYFYDLDPPHLVASIVSEPAILERALKRLVQRLS